MPTIDSSGRQRLILLGDTPAATQTVNLIKPWQAFAGVQMNPYQNSLVSMGVSGFSLSSQVGTLSNPDFDLTNKVKAISRSSRVQSTTGDAGCGEQLGTTIGNKGPCYFPASANVGGFEISFLAGFDSQISTAADTQFVYGIYTNTGGMPASGFLIDNAAAEWFGIYKPFGTSTISFGYKLASAGIVKIADLSTVWGPLIGWSCVITANPANQSVSYSVKEITGLGQLTEILSGSSSAWNPGFKTVAPSLMAWRLNGAGNLSTWISSALVQYNLVGSASL